MALDIQKADGLDVYDVENDTVVLHLATREVHKLNPSAAYIWYALDKANSVVEIAETLSQEAEIPLATANQDVNTFISTLLEQGLLINKAEENRNGT
ncbi:MAG: PqqD family protein [Oceanococcus sp.]